MAISLATAINSILDRVTQYSSLSISISKIPDFKLVETSFWERVLFVFFQVCQDMSH